MRIRATKPEFWRSRTIASVSWDARLTLKGLESYVDDNGVGKDDIALIVGDVFPRDMYANPRETVARVSEAISDLHQAGLIWRYEADGLDLLYISNWEDIQRIDKPGKGRLRRPDGTIDFRESVIRESVARPRESVAPGTGEQGNRGTGEQVFSSEIADATPDPETPPTEPSRPDVERLCALLADRIEANGIKRPNITKRWRTDARLLIDKDGYAEADIAAVIEWATNDTFWRGNILSMPTLRSKYGQLVIKMNAPRQQSGYRNQNQIMADMRARAHQGSALALIEGAGE